MLSLMDMHSCKGLYLFHLFMQVMTPDSSSGYGYFPDGEVSQINDTVDNRCLSSLDIKPPNGFMACDSGKVSRVRIFK